MTNPSHNRLDQAEEAGRLGAPRRRPRRRGRLEMACAAVGASALLAACGSGPTTGSAASASAPPSASMAAWYPQSWAMYASNGDHNAAFRAPAAAKPLWNGYSWNYAEAQALPLGAPAKDTSVLGARGAPVKTTQDLGNSVGVSVVGGVVYSESDTGHLYAINASTGKAIWQASGDNAFMGDPVVEQGVVVAGTGDAGFSFAQVLRYVNHKPAVRGVGWSAIYGFDARTGKQLWRTPTKGEAMSSLAYRGGVVFEGTGDGHVLALDIHTGALRWSANLGGFDSMSSLAVDGSSVLVGMSNPNYVYALDATSGKMLWRQTVANVANTGMGDNSPAVDTANGVVVQDSVVDPDPAASTVDLEVFAMDAASGQILWQSKLGRGTAPPAYKAGLAMIHAGVVYVGNPATSTLNALSEKTGAILWRFQVPGAGPAGAGRGGTTYYAGTVWLAAGPNLYALDPANGKLLGKKLGGGRYGIVNPVIVGGTMYLGNSWAWTQAVPLSAIYPKWRSAPGAS